ncbi:hypothetical protein GSI_05994 [Ganoderma sinense ZZ0214-1]|uniref:Uncharacterized protein n=1 Tax=Ganoderma sinense ZZ0214-1 TaxID=1077348 RepID=A0A2G8SC00_9APHY|nr:hypothetical protein GSI_05994 [Ganoderma sinense ZZ0214-1]
MDINASLWYVSVLVYKQSEDQRQCQVNVSQRQPPRLSTPPVRRHRPVRIGSSVSTPYPPRPVSIRTPQGSPRRGLARMCPSPSPAALCAPSRIGDGPWHDTRQDEAARRATSLLHRASLRHVVSPSPPQAAAGASSERRERTQPSPPQPAGAS